MGRITFRSGKGCLAHNRRDFRALKEGQKPKNIDPSRTCENVVLVDLDVREVYHQLVDAAVAEYNAKRKRGQSKINDYYEYVRQHLKAGQYPFREIVVQWGKWQALREGLDNRQRARDTLVVYARNFEMRNPNLKVIGAFVHMDEASPHLHLDFIPVAHGYKRGMATRYSFTRALREMGFTLDQETRYHNPQTLWREHERAYFTELCREAGLEVEPERQWSRRHLEPEEYREAKDEMINDIQADIAEQAMELEQYREAVARVESSLGEKTEALKAAEVRAQEAEKRADELVQGVMELKPLAAELEQNVSELDRVRERLNKEIAGVADELHVAKNELAIVESALKRRMDEGEALFTSAGLAERIAAARAEEERKRTVKLMEAFVEHPKIQPLWQQYLQLLAARGKQKKLEHNRDE